MNNDNLIGRVINERYELLEVVGSGGMATVYKAQDRLLNRFVAVKILKDSMKYDSEILEKFSSEAKAAASLSHNNIVSVYDVGTSDGISYIVMEYIDGETLKEYINKNKPIKWQTACEIAIQIANALSAAHENGIIHRDIKPHNILITKDATVKVADFGIARAVSSDTVVAGGSALGSVHYISPEQARGGFVDNSSDLYSLGVVLYEMLTGSLPFDGDNAVSIALKKLEEEPLSPKVINLDIPQTLDTIVMKAISKEQHMRYKSAEDFAADLKELLNEDSMHIISPRRPEDEDNEDGTSQRGRGKKKSKKSSAFNPIIGSVVLVAIIAVVTYLFMNGGRKEYIVPNLINKTLEEAINEVNGTEFSIDEEGIVYEVSEDVEEGRIIRQNPGANQSVKKNKKIQLTVSSGVTEGTIPVPKVVDMDYEAAKSILADKGLKSQIIEEESSEYALNMVISQSPKTGTKVTDGSTVILHVCTKVIDSEDNSTVTVPNLKGMTRSDAEKALRAKGLVIGNTKKQLADISPGQIISQEPEDGTSVAKGSSVDIVISEQSQAGSTTSPIYSTPSPTPVSPPQNTHAQQPDSGSEVKRKTLSINIPDSAGDTVQVRVLANGKEIHNGTHSKSEGKIDIPVESSTDAEVEVYMDGELVVRKIVEFK